jgi:hypothetical protein
VDTYGWDLLLGMRCDSQYQHIMLFLHYALYVRVLLCVRVLTVLLLSLRRQAVGM